MSTQKTSRTLKVQHEISIGNAFVKSLNCESQFLFHGRDDGEPDLIYLIAGRKVGIEIVTAYYDEDQAKAEWQLARGRLKPDPSGFTKIGSWSEPEKLIISSVQRRLDEKCKKAYVGAEALWLCIYQHAPIADVSETEQLVASVRIPSRHPFERINLCFYAHAGDGGGFRVYDLPPNSVRETRIS